MPRHLSQDRPVAGEGIFVMQENPSADFTNLLQRPGVISAADVLHFRREVFRDGIVSQAEAEAVFALNDRAGETCPEWTEFFVEALVDRLPS